MRTHTKETTGIQDLAYNTTTSSTLCRMPYLNKKQNKTQTQSSPDRITTSLSLAHQRKNKQKLSTNLTLYKAYTNHWTKLRRAETTRKKEFSLEVWEKETSNTIS